MGGLLREEDAWELGVDSTEVGEPFDKPLGLCSSWRRGGGEVTRGWVGVVLKLWAYW